MEEQQATAVECNRLTWNRLTSRQRAMLIAMAPKQRLDWLSGYVNGRAYAKAQKRAEVERVKAEGR